MYKDVLVHAPLGPPSPTGLAPTVHSTFHSFHQPWELDQTRQLAASATGTPQHYVPLYRTDIVPIKVLFLHFLLLYLRLYCTFIDVNVNYYPCMMCMCYDHTIWKFDTEISLNYNLSFPVNKKNTTVGILECSCFMDNLHLQIFFQEMQKNPWHFISL